MKSFPTYSGPDGAKTFAEAKDLHQGSPAACSNRRGRPTPWLPWKSSTPSTRPTGKRVSLLAAVSAYRGSTEKLHGHFLDEVVDGFLRAVATVTRKDLVEAVEEFLSIEEPHTKSSEGQHAQLSARYHYNRAIMLRRFTGTFSGYAVCDLDKHDLDALFAHQVAVRNV